VGVPQGDVAITSLGNASPTAENATVVVDDAPEVMVDDGAMESVLATSHSELTPR
jgi:hypothetical protein